jgi:hypothetical protein
VPSSRQRAATITMLPSTRGPLVPPVTSDRDARLLFWELVLPAQEEIEAVIANMSAAPAIKPQTPGIMRFS